MKEVPSTVYEKWCMKSYHSVWESAARATRKCWGGRWGCVAQHPLRIRWNAILHSCCCSQSVAFGTHCRWRKKVSLVYCLKHAPGLEGNHLLLAPRVCPNHGGEALRLGLCQQCCHRSLICLMHQSSAAPAELEHCGLRRGVGRPSPLNNWICSCKCKDLQFVSSVSFCSQFGDSWNLTPRQSVEKGLCATPSLYMFWGCDFWGSVLCVGFGFGFYHLP